MERITKKQALQELKRMKKKAKSLSDLARNLKISKQYLCDIFKGRREMGPIVLEAMEIGQIPPPEPMYYRLDKSLVPRFRWSVEELMEEVKYENEPETKM